MSFRRSLLGEVFANEPMAVLIGVGFFVAGNVLAWQELSYGLRGRTADGVVTKSAVETFVGIGVLAGGESTRRTRVVRFEFEDGEGRSRNGRTDVAADVEIAVGDDVIVQYLPGESGDSRLARGPRWWAVACFATSLVVPVVFWIRMHRLANAPLEWRGRRVRRPPPYRFR